MEGMLDVISNPLPIEIKNEIVTAKSELQIKLATGGGVAIRFSEIN